MKIIKKIIATVVISALVLFLFQAKIQWPQESQAQSKKAWVEGTPDGYSPSSDLKALNSAFKSLASVVAPTVVNIFTTSKVQTPGYSQFGPQAEIFRYFFGNPFQQPGRPQEREQNSMGSGFVINEEGLIVTNSHVVTMNNKVADQVRVKFITDTENSRGTPVEVVGVDPLTDVAVLKVSDKSVLKKLKTATLGDSDKISVGEIVFAVGNPLGHMHSVTQGIVSALGRENEINASNFIQTDTSINPGNSGGPLFNIDGEVIGINTAIDARAQGIGFAIPINSAKRVITQLVEKGEVTWGYIGIQMQPMNAQMAKSLGLKSPKGAFVVEVEQGGPADKAGLQSYDVITKIGKKEIDSIRELSLTVRSLAPKTKTDLHYIREGKERKTTIVIGERDKGQTVISQNKSEKPSEGTSLSKLGVKLSPLTRSLRSQLGIKGVQAGVVVVGVEPESMGAQMGLVPGDLITEVNRSSVKTVDDVAKAVASNKESILIKVINGDAQRVLFAEF